MPTRAPRISVLAPDPLLTVTVEPGDDTGDDIHLHAGGQGVWIARLAHRLGADVTLCATASGEIGHVLAAMLGNEGFASRIIEGTGTNGAYVHDRRSGSRVEVASMPSSRLDRHQLDDLYGALLTSGLDADVVVLGGPSRPGALDDQVYRRLTVDLRANHRCVVADLSDGPLDAVLAGGADVVKASHEELVADGWATDDSDDALIAALRRMVDAGAGTAVATRAEHGALAHDGQRTLVVTTPVLDAIDHRGAGDSFTAGLATALAAGDPLEDALRTAGAAGCLNVSRRGAGTGHVDDVARLRRHIDVRPC